MKTNLFKILLLASVVIFGLSLRLVPTIPNFSPFLAIAMFSGIFFDNKKLALFLPLAIQIGLDLTLGYGTQELNLILVHMTTMYLGIICIIGLGFLVKKNYNFRNTIFGISGGTIAFFLITNLGSWLTNPIYSSDFSGLLASYLAGLEFLKYSLMSGILFSIILFVMSKVFSLSLSYQKA